jgi:hypothetical protein
MEIFLSIIAAFIFIAFFGEYLLHGVAIILGLLVASPVWIALGLMHILVFIGDLLPDEKQKETAKIVEETL